MQCIHNILAQQEFLMIENETQISHICFIFLLSLCGKHIQQGMQHMAAWWFKNTQANNTTTTNVTIIIIAITRKTRKRGTRKRRRKTHNSMFSDSLSSLYTLRLSYATQGIMHFFFFFLGNDLKTWDWVRSCLASISLLARTWSQIWSQCIHALKM